MSAFPTSPVNGQTANVNGVTYTYSSALTAWTVTSGGGSLTVASAVSATGNITGGNILTSGLMSATGNIISGANISSGNILTGGLSLSGNVLSAILATANITTTANISGGNLLGTLVGNVTATTVSATGNITGGNLIGTLAGGSSNIAIVSNGDILLTVGSTANVATFTSTGIANTRITPRVANNGATVSGNITPTSDTADQYNILGLTGNISIQNPSGTPTDGQKLTLRIKDNGVARGITWSTAGANSYRVVSTTLPLTTSAGKVTYVGCIYNSTDVFWDVIAVATQA